MVTPTSTPGAATVQRLSDEQAVRDLGHRFADACNCGDVIANTSAGLRPRWDVFVQMPGAPVIRVDGDRASSPWTVSEYASNADELARTPDGWRYVTRHYRYYHLDQAPDDR